MKFLFDFFPLLAFYTAYKLYDIFIATGVIIVATVIQVGYTWIRYKKVQNMHLVTLVLVVVFGGATILLHDAEFIKWKVSIVNWLFGVAFLGSQYIGNKNLVQRMLDTAISVPDTVWTRLNLSWSLFFLSMGFLNLYVFKNFDESTWVDFKVYGLLGLTAVFIIAQGFYLSRHASDDSMEEKE